jgi:hypothetical protein
MIEYEQLHLYPPIISDDSLREVFNQALQALLKEKPAPRVEARFYPYTGLSSTIRLRQGRVFARVSDVLKGSPREVLYALACILVAKLYRVKASKVHERIYRAYALDAPMVDATQASRRLRGYKLTTSSTGSTYDLAKLFSDLNTRYFGGKLDSPLLSWSQRPARRILGHYDDVHRAIIISKSLDNARIPRFVIEYVLYHEMLHVKHPARVVSGRTIHHSRAFREDERLFEEFDKALTWLKKIAPRRRKRARKRASRTEPATSDGTKSPLVRS